MVSRGPGRVLPPPPDLPRPSLLDRMLLWEVPPGWTAISSAAVGGGLLRPRWVLNVGVGADFDRTDLDAHAADLADGLGLAGPGCALLTAADVTQVEHVEDAGVHAWATVGVTKPTWPVRPVQPGHAPAPPPGTAGTPDLTGHPGTVNIVVALPVPLCASALVQAVGTVTETKAQVLVQAGVPGTGTASDAVVVLCPGAGGSAPARFAGVRSPWGVRVARAVHAAVTAGLAAHPWPADDVDPTVVW